MSIETDQITLAAIMAKARERRWQQKLKLAGQGNHVISLQLNVPGYPKVFGRLDEFFSLISREITDFFRSYCIFLNLKEQVCESDDTGSMTLFGVPADIISARQLKVISEQFEEAHPLGRFIDVDILEATGEAISSGKLKPCFYCQAAPAFICRRENKHDINVLREFIESKVNRYIAKCANRQLAHTLSAFACRALLHEVSLTPKPGLVTRTGAGAHADMDFTTFLDAIGSFSQYFQDIVRLTDYIEDQDVAAILPAIRRIGLQMEVAMNGVTNRVNTHKGAIFLMALAVFCAAKVIREKGVFKLGAFVCEVQRISIGLVQRELCLKTNGESTHGQKCFEQYGLEGSGARGEAEQGFPSVVYFGLPVIKEGLKMLGAPPKDGDLRAVLIEALLNIMTVNNDTNVLFRHGWKVLEEIKCKSIDALSAWRKGDKGLYLQMVEECRKRRISPGGSADLLSVSMFVYYCDNQFR